MSNLYIKLGIISWRKVSSSNRHRNGIDTAKTKLRPSLACSPQNKNRYSHRLSRLNADQNAISRKPMILFISASLIS